MRKNESRSKELDIVRYINRDKISDFKSYVISNPEGGEFVNDKKIFVYGNISRLLKDMKWDDPTGCFPINSSSLTIYHLDGINQNKKQELEQTYNLTPGSLSGKSKADIFIITPDKKYIFSFKDGQSVAKLGQVSAETTYGNASLIGGHGLGSCDDLLLMSDIPITISNTSLTFEQFSKLSDRDKRYAVVKHTNSKKWEEHVRRQVDLSVKQIQSFARDLTGNKNSFLEYILYTLFGMPNPPEYFNLLIGQKIIYSKVIIDFLLRTDYSLDFYNHKTDNKTSIVITLTYKSKTYGITKIEPSFDGANKKVSQTKGIIYYFQQFQVNGNTIWDLLKDIS